MSQEDRDKFEFSFDLNQNEFNDISLRLKSDGDSRKIQADFEKKENFNVTELQNSIISGKGTDLFTWRTHAKSFLEAYPRLHLLNMERSHLRFTRYRGMQKAVSRFVERFIGPYDIKKVMLWIGGDKFGKTKPGTTPTSVGRIIRELKRRGLLVGKIDEFKTTHICSGCCGTGCSKKVVFDFKAKALNTPIDYAIPFDWNMAVINNIFNVAEAERLAQGYRAFVNDENAEEMEIDDLSFSKRNRQNAEEEEKGCNEEEEKNDDDGREDADDFLDGVAVVGGDLDDNVMDGTDSSERVADDGDKGRKGKYPEVMSSNGRKRKFGKDSSSSRLGKLFYWWEIEGTASVYPSGIYRSISILLIVISTFIYFSFL
jgi:hypothetical protein